MHQQNFLSKTRSPYFGSQRPWTFILIGMLLLITQVATLAQPTPPDAETSSSYIHRGKIIHNGRAILPVGFYVEYNTVADKLAALDVLGPAGFDVFSYGVGKAKKDSLIQFVERINDYGVRLVYGLFGGDSPITGAVSPLNDWVLQDEGAPIRNNPALLSYYHSDDVRDLRADDLLEKQRVIKAAFPDHITSHSTGVATLQDSLIAYAESADMPGIQIYPAGYWGHNVHFHTNRMVEAAERYGHVPMVVPQAHSLDEFFPGEGRSGWPTPDEQDMYIYSSVAGGAKSFFYYTYGKDLNGRRINPGGFAAYQPALWERTVQMRKEIAALERVLLFGEHTTTPERTFDVYYGRWVYGDKVYVVALNSFQFGQPPVGGGEETNGGRRAISVPLPKGTQGPARPLFDRGNDLSFANGTLSGTLDSVSVQVYELDYTAPVVANGDFEEDFQGWTPESDAEVVAEGDTKALRARTSAGASVTVDITHRILPGQTYTLSADLKSATSTSGITAFVQVRDYRDEIIYTESLAALTPTFETQTLTFTAPEEFGSVIVGVWRNETGSGEAWVDNLRVSKSVETDSADDGQGSITVRAQGDCGSEVMELRVDGSVVKEWMVTTRMSDYVYEGFTQGDVSVHFVNDRYRPGQGGCEDRNLAVDYITVCGSQYQTETQATETATCCTNVTDKLFTNGNFDFGSLTCGSAAQARGASDNAKVSPRKATTATIEVYPNPGTNGVFHLKNTAKLSGEITVTDLSGRTVEKTPTPDHGTTVDLSGEPDGVYLLRTSTGQTIKLIKE